MIKLALTDLDDTLMPYGSPRASDRAIAALHAVFAAGLHAGPVSGRIPAAMAWMFGGDEACCATGAFANGQIVRLDGETVHVEPIDAAHLDHVASVCDDAGDAVLVIFDPLVDDGGSFVTRRPDQLARIMEYHSGTIFCNPRWRDRTLERLGTPSHIKANVRVAGNLDRREAVRDLLRRECPQLDFVFPSASAPLVDISPAGWNKGSAVRVLARELGIELDEVATFGDSENDLPMMRAVRNSVAVGNAAPEVRACARWHIGPCADDAVAEALEEIALSATDGSMPAFMRGDAPR